MAGTLGPVAGTRRGAATPGGGEGGLGGPRRNIVLQYKVGFRKEGSTGPDYRKYKNIVTGYVTRTRIRPLTVEPRVILI